MRWDNLRRRFPPAAAEESCRRAQRRPANVIPRLMPQRKPAAIDKGVGGIATRSSARERARRLSDAAYGQRGQRTGGGEQAPVQGLTDPRLATLRMRLWLLVRTPIERDGHCRQPLISLEERARPRGVNAAHGSVRLEGLIPSPEAEALAEQYVEASSTSATTWPLKALP